MSDRRYETLVVLHPDLGEPGTKDLAVRIRSVIETQGGTVTQLQEWGLRELAYPMAKQRRAFYVLFEHRSSSRGLTELERQLKIMDNVLRHISVRTPENAPPAPAPRSLRREAEDAPVDAVDVGDISEGEGV